MINIPNYLAIQKPLGDFIFVRSQGLPNGILILKEDGRNEEGNEELTL